MNCPKCGNEIDLTLFADAELRSLAGRIRAGTIKRRSGGVIWRKHNPKQANCRCMDCTVRRAKERAE